jgi:hypothetical protein
LSLLLLKTTLERVLKKKLFSHKKKISLINDNKGYILASLLERCTFFYLFLFFRDRTGCGAKNVRISKRVATRKEIILCKKFKNVYSSFIPPDLTEMVVSWANGNLFE